MVNRSVLHKSKLSDFTKWLDKEHISWDWGQAQFEVLRIYKTGKPPLILYKKHEPTAHVSVPEKAMHFVYKFLREAKRNEKRNN